MDPEIAAMQKVADALADLDDAAALRVIQWAIAKRGVALTAESASGEVNETPDEFADLFYRVDPQSNSERALVAAFWLAKNSGESFTAQAINSLLKDLGYQVPNITDALSQSMREKPALIIQVKKGGSTKQARKQYRITDAGLRRVREVISRGST